MPNYIRESVENGFNSVVRERNTLYVFMFEFISDYFYSDSFSIHVFIRY